MKFPSIVFMISAFVMGSGCSSERSVEYGRKFEMTSRLIARSSDVLRLKCGEFSEKWHNAIENSKHPSSLEWKTDGSEPLPFYDERLKEMKRSMRELADPPANYAEAHDLLLQRLVVCDRLTQMAKAPFGLNSPPGNRSALARYRQDLGKLIEEDRVLDLTITATTPNI